MEPDRPILLAQHRICLAKLVEEYCHTQRNTNLPAFQIFGSYTVDSVLKNAYSEGVGCYAIYTGLGQLKYIGMSQQAVGYRARSHFSKSVQAAQFWARGSRATYIDLIITAEIWEPPSLEVYLTIKSTDLRAAALTDVGLDASSLILTQEAGTI